VDRGRRSVLAATAAAGALGTLGGAATLAAARDVDALLDGSALDLQAALARGLVSPVEVAEATVRRIAAGARLNAVVEFDADAFVDAARRLARTRDARRLPLYGVPVALKDNVDALPYRTTAGTPALREHRPQRDAELVRRLRAAGALIAGKTNMDELAAWGTTHNGVYGRTANPYAPDRHTGGSSGGSAAAVAARLVPAAIGTDTAGSVRNPASFCGVVGFRPTHDRVPARGVVPLARRRDAVGPFARSVRDIGVLDAVLAGDAPPLVAPALAGLRLGVPRVPFQRDLQPDVARTFEAALATLRERGVQLVEGEIPDLEALSERLAVVTIGGAVRADLEDYLRDSGANVSVDDVARQLWHPAVRAWLGEYFTPRLEVAAEFERAWAEDFVRLQAKVRAWFETHRLAALVCPCVPIVAAVEVPRTGDLVIDGERVANGVWRNVQNTTAASVWDGPGIALPAGMSTDGLPIGIELDGPLGRDRELVGVALAVEAVLPKQPPPPAA
jgi:mandelamide amidase